MIMRNILLSLLILLSIQAFSQAEIVGGEDCDISDYPWQAAIYAGGYLCGASVINDYWVLTAAHNFITDTETPELLPEDLSFRLGRDYNEFDKEFLIENVFYHPAWVENIDSGDEYGFDIALIELQESVQSITPALYHKDGNETLDSKIFLSGFGDYEPRFDDEW